jgi:bifunctional non-homologous end joining protein LigD
VPTGSEWVHEIKHDGYRLIVRRDGNRVRLYTRRGYNWSHGFPLIVHAMTRLKVRSVIIDGEAVICDHNGLSNFDKLHSQSYDDQVVLYAFDLIELDGEDWRSRPLEERKTRRQVAKQGRGRGLLERAHRGRWRDHLRARLPHGS